MVTLHAPAQLPVPRFPLVARRRGGSRRSVLLLLVVSLLLATGAALLGIGATLTHSSVPKPSANPAAIAAAENAEAVGAFYSAVNEAVRTGDASPLDALVVLDVVWCLSCPGQAPGRAGLARYLAELHHAAPETRLIVDEVVGGLLETVTVRVRVSGAPVVSPLAPWGPVDTLRLVDGLIAERRNGPDGAALAEPLIGAQLEALPPAVTGVVMARLTFAVGAGMDGLLSAGPTLLVVESGALFVRIAYGGRVLRGDGQVETGDGGERGTVLETVLRQGDGAIVPAAARHSLRQDGAEPAVAVGATLAFRDKGSDRSRPRHPELGVFEPMDRVFSDEGVFPPAVRVLVNEGVETWGPEPVRVAIGRVVLGPGARVIPPGDETLVVAVEAGTLGVAGGEDRTVVAGSGVLEPPGLDRELRNAGTGVLVLLVLTVAPVTA